MVPEARLSAATVLVVGEERLGDVESGLSRRGATVETARTHDEVTERLPGAGFDAVVTAYALPDSDGVALVEELRATTTTKVPVVIVAADGSEEVASAAISAGVTDYFDATSTPDLGERVADRVRRALDEAASETQRRARARRFDARFRNGGTYSWVLDAAGCLTRANRRALSLVSAPHEDLLGERFWTLPWWDDPSTVRSAVEAARDGEFVEVEVSPTTDDDRPTLELTVQPVRDERGEVVSILVEGTDITERRELEAELRASEELHRVTLNNMTDTVLITDDDGAFTYVCPNVYFIFGYSAEEIHDLGTIDELLGEDLFDPEELEREGTLTNVETTATDKHGREHTLLVNVRQVSIQGGTTLYSCRDITTRKQREDALAALHRTTRELLYAETAEEIADLVVDAATDILEPDACGLYRFDSAENALHPTAYSREMEALSGPLPTLAAGDGSLVGRSFVEGEPTYLDDVDGAELSAEVTTDVRSGAFVPVGDHGVFVAGSTETGQFDEVARELTELLAATTAAALDRVEREQTLRTQERELQEQNDQLTRLNRINETIREIDQALVEASTREEIADALCDHLTSEDRFTFAWVGELDRTTGEVRPEAWAGGESGYLDSVALSSGDEAAEPAARAATTRDAVVVPNVSRELREEAWRKEALSRDFQSVASVPLTYDGFLYGVLTVYADTPSAFGEMGRSVLTELGETTASALSAVERKSALLTTSSTRCEFSVEDPGFVLLGLARRADCTLSFQGGVRLSSDGVYVFATVEATALDDVLAVCEDMVAIEDARVINEDGPEATVRLRLSAPFVALRLADHGAVLRSATVDPDGARVVVDVPDSVDARSIVQLLTDEFDDVELLSKQTDRASTNEFYSTVLDRLTDRQLEVIQAAYYAGFFQSPRETTGEEVAETLDISPPAFYRHNRTVQRKLLSTLFEDVGLPVESPADG